MEFTYLSEKMIGDQSYEIRPTAGKYEKFMFGTLNGNISKIEIRDLGFFM